MREQPGGADEHRLATPQSRPAASWAAHGRRAESLDVGRQAVELW
jgi:hypothetical protein